MARFMFENAALFRLIEDSTRVLPFELYEQGSIRDLNVFHAFGKGSPETTLTSKFLNEVNIHRNYQLKRTTTRASHFNISRKSLSSLKELQDWPKSKTK
jgi:hypothetical protein